MVARFGTGAGVDSGRGCGLGVMWCAAVQTRQAKMSRKALVCGRSMTLERHSSIHTSLRSFSYELACMRAFRRLFMIYSIPPRSTHLPTESTPHTSSEIRVRSICTPHVAEFHRMNDSRLEPRSANMASRCLLRIIEVPCEIIAPVDTWSSSPFPPEIFKIGSHIFKPTTA